MKVIQKHWPIKRIIEAKGRINVNPTWQRGPAWKAPRQVLLIDSILRGMDIPKLYLRRLANPNPYQYEVVDGQQRLRAIWQFSANTLPLRHSDPLQPISGHQIDKQLFKGLHRELKEQFAKFVVSVAEIVSGSSDEITNLFSRLQMGVSLNPAELRNAILGPMKYVIDSMATSHTFFSQCRIPDNRYKRQDYVALAFAVAAFDGQRDVKAPDLKRMYLEFTPLESDHILKLSAKVGDALSVLAEINTLVNYKITQKWMFVDLLWLIMQHHSVGSTLDVKKAANSYMRFEDRRKEFNSKPEVLIQSGKRVPALDQHLYNYIAAFRVQGGQHDNLKVRNRTLRAYFRDIDRGD